MRQIDECASTFFRQASILDLYFLEWYELICGNVCDPHSFGSEASMEHVLGHWAGCPLLKNSGTEVQMARWYSIVDRLEELISWWWQFTAVLVLVCLQGHVRHPR